MQYTHITYNHLGFFLLFLSWLLRFSFRSMQLSARLPSCHTNSQTSLYFDFIFSNWIHCKEPISLCRPYHIMNLKFKVLPDIHILYLNMHWILKICNLQQQQHRIQLLQFYPSCLPLSLKYLWNQFLNENDPFL